MNLGTKVRTVLAIATSLNTALMATDLTGFNNHTVDIIYRVMSIILNFVIVACVTYYNNDYTPEHCEATGEARAKIAERKGKVKGEYFYMDDDDDLDVEEGAEDESDDI